MDKIITTEHGSGGIKTSALIEKLALPAFGNGILNELGDAASLEGSLLFSTDSFVVSPYFFPGGDIGKLSVCGTVNDIAVSGGELKYLSLAVILEEGLPVCDLEKIISSIAETAKAAGIQIVTGDTKVVEKGKGDGIYINTSGIGKCMHSGLSPRNIRPGDNIIVSGTIGDHGISVMLARNPGLIDSKIISDCAPVNNITLKLLSLGSDLKVMRDPTRGGVATTLCEFADACSPDAPAICIELDESSLPVRQDVKAACDMLGLDPLYSACEGRFLAVVSSEKADDALKIIRSESGGEGACIIGQVTDEYPGKVLLNTKAGGKRILNKLSGSLLPRIC